MSEAGDAQWALAHKQLRECFRCPEIKESVTFQHFLELLSVMARKLEAGESIQRETAQMVSLRSAIEAEMALITGRQNERH
jgi:hypothetical protein